MRPNRRAGRRTGGRDRGDLPDRHRATVASYSAAPVRKSGAFSEDQAIVASEFMQFDFCMITVYGTELVVIAVGDFDSHHAIVGLRRAEDRIEMSPGEAVGIHM
jgi:hypothetical protein